MATIPALRRHRGAAATAAAVRDALERATPVALLLVVAAVPTLVLAPWVTALFDRDEAAYAVVALGMDDGRVPYRDLFDHKPPAIYAIYWMSFRLGHEVWAPRLFALAAAALTALLVARAGRTLSGSRVTGAVAGLLFGLSLSNVALRANANTEIFALAPLTAALVAALRPGRRSALVAGALSGVAVLCKTSVALQAAALLLAVATGERRGERSLVFCGGLAVPLLSVGALFALSGAADEAWYANVTYNRLYGAEVPMAERLTNVFSFRHDVLVGGLPFWALGAAGAGIAAWRRGREGWLVLLWAAGSWGAVKLTGRDLAHYYVQLLPAAALLGALALERLTIVCPRALRGVLALGVLGPLLAFQAALWAAYAFDAQRRAEVHSETLHACDAAAPVIGAWVAAHTAPGEPVYNLGRDTGVYFYAHRPPAHRMLYDRSFYLDPPTASETAASLRRDPPRIIIDSHSCIPGLPPLPAFETLLAERYARVATVEHATMYEPRH